MALSSKKILSALLFAGFLFACETQNIPKEEKTKTVKELPDAPEINTKFGWLNAEKSYSIKDFRGKIVLLDFWTFGCVNCQHIIPELKKLEKEYADELVVVGVHSAKFASEKDNKKIKNAILKFGIEHPVVNDADFKVWDSYKVNAWPTIVLIDPDGKIVKQHAGEGFYEVIKKSIDEIIEEKGDKIDRKPIAFQLEKSKEVKSMLRYPSKMIADSVGNIYFSDSGNHRILKIDQNGAILAIIGNGKEGFTNGNYQQSSFYEPQGLALKGNILYIADTKNNAIRKVDLTTQSVLTVAGDGSLGYYFLDEDWGVPVNPNSPWDLWIDNDSTMYIANAGNHQILRMDLKKNKVYRFAGSGREALTDGNFRETAFNQPSGLAKIGDIMYVADAEASAIRAVNLKNRNVMTILGKGLFEFGDKDGSVENALLQHSVGLADREGKIYIADTYNGKIKVFDLQTKILSTLVSDLDEPNDLVFIGNNLWVSNTNQHQLIKIDLTTLKKEILEIKKPQ